MLRKQKSNCIHARAEHFLRHLPSVLAASQVMFVFCGRVQFDTTVPYQIPSLVEVASGSCHLEVVGINGQDEVELVLLPRAFPAGNGAEAH
eukprot:8091440-Pyramimonas_sp.AAC.1